MIHSFEPVIDHQSKILILGSIPSLESLRQQQYYGHPQNRFWRIMAHINGSDFANYQAKMDFLTENGFALWDVIASCERYGSLDSAITDVADNAIVSLMSTYPNVLRILCNGKTGGSIYAKHFASQIQTPYFVLPSTSAANAAYSFQRLLDEWLPNLKI